ncbi:DNA-processing protein DprA [Streptococcaceae bacterium ESL0729]|nr:DNA-processing protein DprA [Streptococcaceae bacterium ESL0729]
MKYDDEQIAQLILSLQLLKGVGNKTIVKMLKEKKQEILATKNFDQNFLDSLKIRAITSGLEKTLRSWSNLKLEAANIIELAFKEGIAILHPFMADYPQRLLTNDNFPPVLFCKGDVSLLNSQKMVAIIGTRKPTELGEKLGFRLSTILSQDGYTIVSGLAVGCDTLGHEGAVVNNGKTIAVLPTPIDAPVYPKDNQKLANEILDKGGLLLSEYPPGKKLQGRELISNLVARDEWQAGLSDGVIAIETSVSGGTNHAIKHAISTKTPLAVFDYSPKLNQEFFTNPRFGGNLKYLTEGTAQGIFFPESIEEFKESMNEYNKYVNLKGNDFIHLKKEESLPPKNIEFDVTQIDLFDC